MLPNVAVTSESVDEILKCVNFKGEKLNYKMVAMDDFLPSYLGLLNFPGFELWP